MYDKRVLLNLRSDMEGSFWIFMVLNLGPDGCGEKNKITFILYIENDITYIFYTLPCLYQ